MGVRTVAVYSDADRDARHVALADEARRIGPPAARDSYLNAEAILAAARETGAEAIHPGYGFLSENEDFAAACAKAGIVFIGPSPEAIARWATSRRPSADGEGRRAAGARLPRREPGSRFLQKEADEIGFPGADQGRRRRRRQGHAHRRRGQGFRGSARIARSARRRTAFGDDRVLVEKYRRPAAPHRGAGDRRQARQRRLPLRARLHHPAAPPEGGGGGARAGLTPACARRWARPPSRRRSRRLHRRRHGGVPAGRGRRRSTSWR